MMHLPTCFVAGLAVILGEAIASNVVPAEAAFSGFMTGLLLSAAHMALNDSDREMKQNSRSNEALNRVAVKPSQVFSLATVLASLGVLFAAHLGYFTFLVACVNVAVIAAYHAKLKDSQLVGGVFVGLNSAILFTYGGFAVGSFTLPLAIAASMVFLSSMGRNVMMKPERATAEQSPEIKGAIASQEVDGKISGILFVATALTGVVPVLLGLVSSYYIPLAVVCDVGFLLTAYSMLTNPTVRIARRNENYVLVWLGFGLLAFLTGVI